MITRDQILAKLKTVLDPELGIDVVDLGLIYDIKIDDGRVEILMTLTTPFCPLSAFFEKELVTKVKEVAGVDNVKIDLTFNPVWTPEKMSEAARLQLGL